MSEPGGARSGPEVARLLGLEPHPEGGYLTARFPAYRDRIAALTRG